MPNFNALGLQTREKSGGTSPKTYTLTEDWVLIGLSQQTRKQKQLRADSKQSMNGGRFEKPTVFSNSGGNVPRFFLNSFLGRTKECH